jgi:hypothetical protein
MELDRQSGDEVIDFARRDLFGERLQQCRCGGVRDGSFPSPNALPPCSEIARPAVSRRLVRAEVAA